MSATQATRPDQSRRELVKGIDINRHTYGSWLIAVAAALGFILSLYRYLSVGDGVSFTAGALLVVVSSALILAASLLISLVAVPRWLGITLSVLLLLGLLGTAFAGWLLESYWLSALMIIGLVGWFIHLAEPGPRRPITSHVRGMS
jgi:hypothetical protein